MSCAFTLRRLHVPIASSAFLVLAAMAASSAAEDSLADVADSLVLVSGSQAGGGVAHAAAGGGPALIVPTYTISGRVSTPSDAAVPGVTLTGLPGAPDTAADGTYSGTVEAEWSGTVTPAKPGWLFTPASIAYSLVMADQVYQNYVAEGVAVEIVYVDLEQTSNPETGETWDAAFDTIQEGVDAAFDAGGGAVWVAEGAYTAGAGPVVSLREYVQVYGGFDGTETALEQRDPNAYPTFIDGEGVRRCVEGANTALLDGFVITRGFASVGAGMSNIAADPIVANCLFVENGAGDVVAEDASSPDLGDLAEALVLAAGGSGPGGGAAATGGGGAAGAVLAYDTSAGGAMYNEASSPDIVNCVFWRNVAQDGAGLYNVESDPGVTNCTFTQNTADDVVVSSVATEGALASLAEALASSASGGSGGGGAAASPAGGAAEAVLTYEAAGAMANYDSSPVVTNTVFWDDWPTEIFDAGTSVPSVTYSDVQDGYPGAGNIDDDPLFADPDNGDLQLEAGSPCQDTGTAAGAPATDILGVPRPQCDGIDMGAYEATDCGE